MADRFAPYLPFYASRHPTDSHGVQPAVLVVFDDELAASYFFRVAAREASKVGAPFP